MKRTKFPRKASGIRSKAGPDEYKVGPGHPPRETQWKPGQSGNKKGRKKGSKNRRTIIRKAQQQPHTVVKAGRPQKVLIDEIGIHNIVRDIKGGDRKAYLEWIAISERYGDGNEPVASIEELMEEDKSIMANLLARIKGKSEQGGEER